MVNGTRAWRWSPGGGRHATRHPQWQHEILDEGRAAWYARISAGSDPDLPPLVMVHGVAVSGEYFWPVADCLVDDFRIYVPDLPGTGRSKTRIGVWDIEALADGLGEWMDLHHLTGAVLISNSIGCQVLTLLATKRPDLARMLILVSPTMDPDISSVIRVMARGLMDMPRERPSLWRIWLPDLIRTGPLRGLATLRMAIDDPQEERLGQIAMPVLVVGGEHDPIVPERWVTSLAERVPRGRTIMIPDAPHAMNYTTPRHLARIIRAAIATDLSRKHPGQR